MAKELQDTTRLTNAVSTTHGIQKEWWQWPESMWGTDKGNDTRWIARTLSPDKKQVVSYLTPQQEADLVAQKKKGDKTALATPIDYKSIDSGTYDTIRSGWNSINQRSKDPLNMPSPVNRPVPTQSDIQFLKNNPDQAQRFEARFGAR